MPNSGKLTIKSGKMAQWMAQATEVTTPKASQFILIFMDCKCMHNSNNVAFFIF